MKSFETRSTILRIALWAIAILLLAWLATKVFEQAPGGSRKGFPEASKNPAKPGSMADRKNREIAAEFASAQLLHARERYSEATTRFRTIIQKSPHSDPAWLGLAKSLEAQGFIDQALEAYQRVLGQDVSKYSSYSRDIELLGHYAELCEQRGRSSEASEAYEGMLRSGQVQVGRWAPAIPRSGETLKESKAYALTMRAVKPIARSDTKRALGYLFSALEMKEDSAVTVYYLGLTYDRMRNFPAAKLEFERAKRLAPNDKEIQDAVAHVYKAKYWAYLPKKPMSPLLREYIKKGVKGQTWDPVLKRRVESPGDR